MGENLVDRVLNSSQCIYCISDKKWNRPTPTCLERKKERKKERKNENFKVWVKNNDQLKIPFSVNLSFKDEGKMNSFRSKYKLVFHLQKFLERKEH